MRIPAGTDTDVHSDLIRFQKWRWMMPTGARIRIDKQQQPSGCYTTFPYICQTGLIWPLAITKRQQVNLIFSTGLFQ